jgi:hypothetical protein
MPPPLNQNFVENSESPTEYRKKLQIAEKNFLQNSRNFFDNGFGWSKIWDPDFLVELFISSFLG